MNGLPYYKRYPRDFIEGTIGMPFELKVTYSFILDLIYMQGGNLPDDPRYISGLLGASVRKWKSLRQGLIDAGKLQVITNAEGTFLTNYRAVSELETLAKLSRKQSENRSRPNKNNDLQSPRSNHTEPDTDTEGSANALPMRASARGGGRKPPNGFEEFWSLVPVKADKRKCEQNYAKAVRDGATPDQINAGMRRYRDWLEALGPNAPKAKYPQGWLTGERWNDELPDPSTQLRNGRGNTHGQLAKINDWFRPNGDSGPELDCGSGGVEPGRELPDDGRRGEAHDFDGLGFRSGEISEAHYRAGVHGSPSELDVPAETGRNHQVGFFKVIDGTGGGW